jgi:hypothetical protein
VSSFKSASPILAKAYDTALLDLDGVVYIGDDAVPGVIGALNQAHDEFGMTLLVLPIMLRVHRNELRSTYANLDLKLLPKMLLHPHKLELPNLPN